jgi:hypothetical protein
MYAGDKTNTLFEVVIAEVACTTKILYMWKTLDNPV